ncbi:MAG: septum formation initiator family protein [Oceanicaulis sp.]
MNALKRFGLLGGLCVVIAYLSYHAFIGERGVTRQLDTLERIERAETELAAVRSHRLALEDRVARLSEDEAGVDVDYLEERVRDELRFAHPHEIVVDIARTPAR